MSEAGRKPASTLDTPAKTIECVDGNETIPAEIINPLSYYPESPFWKNGKLYYVEYSMHRVMSWDGVQNRVFWQQDGCGPAAITDFQNDFIVTCYDSNSIARISSADGIHSQFVQSYRGYKGTNDFAHDSLGGVYFTASGVFTPQSPVEGKIYYISRDSQIHLVADGIHYSNGLAVIADGKYLLVSEHLENRILEYAILQDGNLSSKPVRIFADLSQIENPEKDISGGLRGPDGMRLGPDGVLYVAQYGGSRVLKFRIDEDGESQWIGQIQFRSPYPNTDNVYLNTQNVFFGSAVEETTNPHYPGIIYAIHDAKISSRKKLVCEIRK
jgi:sugar lactone lactonase YvrE